MSDDAIAAAAGIARNTVWRYRNSYAVEPTWRSMEAVNELHPREDRRPIAIATYRAWQSERPSGILPGMAKVEHISLRINVTPALYAKIGEFRHAKQFETRAQAMVVLLNAGLAALAAPVSMPKPVAEATPPATPRPVRRRPDPYAGADPTERN